METAILTGMVLLAALSPLLTFANLWQIKEWRLDRLKEHFRSEGLLRQTVGLTRSYIIVLFIIFGLSGMPFWHTRLLLVLCVLSILQIALRKQPFPVWTAKASALVVTSICLNTLILIINFQFSIFNFQLITFIPVIQPLILFIAWALFFPIDKALKQRIIRKATRIRVSLPDLTVIGITGSVGKTTTKELLRHLLAEKEMLATPAYVNSEIGVARWMSAKLSVANPPDILIVEMGAYSRGEISLLCSFTKPKMGIITAIGKQHLALFKTQEALCNAKAELIEALPVDGSAYLNGDNDLCAAIAKKASCPVTTVGTGGTADIEAYDIEETAEGCTFQVGGTVFTAPLHGTHNVTNVLLGIAVARNLGLSDNDIARRLRTFCPPDKTFSVSENGSITVLNDTHNASPSSFRAAIAWARNQPLEEKILLTSGLQELGTLQDRMHAEMGALAANVFQRVIFLHKRNAKSFEKGYGKPVEVFSKTTAPVSKESLLVCIGRMSGQTIKKILP